MSHTLYVGNQDARHFRTRLWREPDGTYRLRFQDISPLEGCLGVIEGQADARLTAEELRDWMDRLITAIAEETA